MSTVTLRGIKKIYDKNIVAVDDFNLEIMDKEFIVLVGPSGCGKSTILRMIAGLEKITAGELYIDDKLVNDTAPKDRDIAMVFQNYALYPHMTVFENMSFGLKLRRYKKDEIKRRVQEAAEILGITDLLDRKPKALSGGQRQRVAIGRAIVREPKVFLMDEPLSNLDAKLRNQMRAELIKLRKRIDTTFVYVTHDQIEAMTLGDRIVIMKDGLVRQIGTPAEVYEKPWNIFVAGFIGTPQMNFFRGVAAKTDGGFAVRFAEEDASVSVSGRLSRILSDKKYDGKELVLGIRPEHLEILINPAELDNTVKTTYTVSEMMGNETYIHMDFAGSDVIARTVTTNMTDEYRASVVAERTLYVRMPPDMIHLFDGETGVSIFG
jgi:multiple sugar transport system ATP-binding protein